jgi:hypothetical protein
MGQNYLAMFDEATMNPVDEPPKAASGNCVHNALGKSL